MSDINFATEVDERRREYFSHSKHTNGYDFQIYRKEIMTEDEIELGQKIVDNFKEAYEYKQGQGVFKDMAIAESYWSGEFKNQPEDAIANTNIINTNIETQVADLMDQNIDVEPIPFDPTDAPYVSRVRKIANKIIEINNMPIKMQRITRRFKKFGHGWIRVLYNPDLLEGIGCPEIESISSANIYPDPAILRPDDINKGRFFIEAFPATIYWAEKTFGMKKASAIYPGYKPYEHDLKFHGDMDTTDERYMHILYWCKYEENGRERLRLIQCSGCGVILKDSKDFEKDKGIAIFPTTTEVRYPYWLTTDMERETSLWGKSNASLLYPLQDVCDEIDNSIIANARLTGNPQKLITTSSGIDPNKIDNTEGQVIVSNTSDGLRYVAPPEMPAYIIQRREHIVNNERVIVSRVSDQQSGVKQQGVDTATESLALQQNAMKSIDATKAVLQVILKDVFMYCIELAIEYWNTGMFFEGNRKGEYEYFNPSELKSIPMLVPASQEYTEAFKVLNKDKEPPMYMEKKGRKKRKIHVILSVSVGAGIPKNKAFLYNLINETYSKGAMGVEEYRQKLEEYIGLPYDRELFLREQQKQAESQVLPMGQEPNVLEQGVSPQAVQRLEEENKYGM